jgi:hypothetical protein
MLSFIITQADAESNSCKALYGLRNTGLVVVCLAAESLLVMRTISLFVCTRKGRSDFPTRLGKKANGLLVVIFIGITWTREYTLERMVVRGIDFSRVRHSSIHGQWMLIQAQTAMTKKN